MGGAGCAGDHSGDDGRAGGDSRGRATSGGGGGSSYHGHDYAGAHTSCFGRFLAKVLPFLWPVPTTMARAHASYSSEASSKIHLPLLHMVSR